MTTAHIEPTMNAADALRQLEPTAQIIALSTVRCLDTALIPARGYPLELLPPVPLPRQLSRDPQMPSRLCDSVRAAGAVLDRVRAEGVIGFGGSRPTLIPVLTDPERIAAMSAYSSWPGTCLPQSPSDVNSPHEATALAELGRVGAVRKC